jgi:hypothetical protein
MRNPPHYPRRTTGKPTPSPTRKTNKRKMAAEDDKKWFKDKEKLVPGFIGAAVRPPPRTHTPPCAYSCYFFAKSCQKHRHKVFFSLFPLSLWSGRVATEPSTFSRRLLPDACAVRPTADRRGYRRRRLPLQEGEGRERDQVEEEEAKTKTTTNKQILSNKKKSSSTSQLLPPLPPRLHARC